MPTRKQHYEEMQKKKALSLLKEFHDRIKKGEIIVEDSGFWAGVEGKLNLKITAKIRDS